MKQWILLWIVCCTITAQAQVNTEILRPAGQLKGARQALDLDLDSQSGNAEWITLGGKYRYDVWAEDHQFFVQLEGEEKHAGGDQVSGGWFLVGRYSQRWQEGIYGEVFVQKEAKEALALTDRQLWGASIRFSGEAYPLAGILPPNWAYYYGVGLMLETEHYSVSDPNHHQTILKSTNYLSWRVPLTETLEWIGVGYLQFALNDWADFRVLIDSSLSVKLTDTLSFLVDINVRYDDQPPVGIARLDTLIKSRLRLTF